MRKVGDVSYREESEKIVLKNIDFYGQTTNAILEKVRRMFPRICFRTVNNILDRLLKDGKVKCKEKEMKRGKQEYVIRLWSS